MEVRTERAGDEEAIHELTAAAFSTAAHSSGTEQFIVDALRRDGDLTLSLVARQGETIIGHVAFSPVTIDDSAGNWYGLGPIATSADHRGQGVARTLIAEGHF